MRHHFRFALVSAVLAAAAIAGFQRHANADDAVLAATLDPLLDRDGVSVPAYVPTHNLAAFLTAAWKTTPAPSSTGATGSVDIPLPAERVVTIRPVVIPPARSTAPSIATLPASNAAVTVTPVSAQSDEAAVKSADIAPVQTSGAIQPPDASKDAVDHIVPATVRDAASSATEKASAARGKPQRMASLSKPRSKKSGKGPVYRDWQVGVPGQSMEPLISMCAQAPRKCSATVEFCGC